jgi:hypothetical protein
MVKSYLGYKGGGGGVDSGASPAPDMPPASTAGELMDELMKDDGAQ